MKEKNDEFKMLKNFKDVPSPIDLKNPKDALQWAQEANEKRPWRYDFFDYYVTYIQKKVQSSNPKHKQIHVLEIGSGPGFLAKHILHHCLSATYTALDFSKAMHELSQSKLLPDELNRAEYIIADFKKPNWFDKLIQYDVVIIHQALHELRHKNYATNFHKEIRTRLKPDGAYLVCDHIVGLGAMTNNELYMTEKEHYQSLKHAGFTQVLGVKQIKGLCLFEAEL